MQKIDPYSIRFRELFLFLTLTLFFQNCGRFQGINNDEFSSTLPDLSNVSGNLFVSSMNRQIDSNFALDWIIQNVCVDANDHTIAGDPTACANHRNVRIGEKIPYLITDSDSANNNSRYFALFSYPVHGTDGTLKVLVSKSKREHFNANYQFSFNENQDGYDLLDTRGDYFSITRTSDAGCLDQKWSTNNQQRENGWILFAQNMGGGQLVHDITHTQLSLTVPSSCTTRNDSGAEDVWNPPTGFTFMSGKTLSSIITYHYANEDLSRAQNAVEKYYFTREYGFTRWEAWITLVSCQQEHGAHSPVCNPNDPNNILKGRCNPSDGLTQHGSQTWVRVDCRDTTFYMGLNAGVIPVAANMATTNGLVDIVPTGVISPQPLPKKGCGVAFDCSHPPQGSYLQSCSSASISNSTLLAICGDGQGHNFSSALDLSNCTTGDISNDYGILVCNGARGIVPVAQPPTKGCGVAFDCNHPPSGSYSQSCSNASISNSMLFAICSDGQGRSFNTTINLANCNVGDIGNSYGTLVCNGARGTSTQR